MSRNKQLEKLCNTIAEQIRLLTIPGDTTGADKLNALADSAKELPYAIVDCLGGGRIKKIYYARTEPPKDKTEKPTTIESYSVEYEKGPDACGRCLLVSLLVAICVLIGMLICCTRCGGQSPQRNPDQTGHSVSHDQNQYVFVEDSDWLAMDRSTTILTTTLDQNATNAPVEVVGTKSTEGTNQNVQQPVP